MWPIAKRPVKVVVHTQERRRPIGRMAIAIDRLLVGPGYLGAAGVAMTQRGTCAELRVEAGLGAIAINRLAVIGGALSASRVGICVECGGARERHIEGLRRHVGNNSYGSRCPLIVAAIVIGELRAKFFKGAK